MGFESSSSSSSVASENNGIEDEIAAAAMQQQVLRLSSSKRVPLLSLNHVSYVCRSVMASVKFYENVLGFVLIKRPSSFNFEGAWLFNHGIGIHLLQSDGVLPKKKGAINPKDNHISFQTSDMGMIIEKLQDMKIEFATAVVKEGGVTVDQLFFHDPDGYMIEICNCQNLPVLPLISNSRPIKKVLPTNHIPKQISNSFYDKVMEKMRCGEGDAEMIEKFEVDMMGLSF